MRKLFALAILLLIAANSYGQNTPAYKIDDLAKRVSNKDTVYVVNFWATWCGPCVRELPEFDKIYEQYAGKSVKVLMVSLDFKEAYPKKLDGFIKKKKMKPEVVWLNESNANEFIPKIDDSWSGSIPATIIYNAAKDVKTFHEGTVTAQQISSILEKQLAQ